MGLFKITKKTPSAKGSTKPKKSGRKGLKFGKKNAKVEVTDMPLVERLELAPIVPVTIAESLQSYADAQDGLVKQRGQYFDVLVVTEDSLSEAFKGLDDNDEAEEELGRLSSDLKNDVIINASTAPDLDALQVIIVPTEASLEALNESTLMTGVGYHVGRFPADGELDDEPVAYDDEMLSVSELMARLDGEDDDAVDDDDLFDEKSASDVNDDSDDANDDLDDLDDSDDELFGDSDDDVSDDGDSLFGPDDDDDDFNFDDDESTNMFAGDDDDDDFGDDFDDGDSDEATSDSALDELPDAFESESEDLPSATEVATTLSERVYKGGDLTLVDDPTRFNETFLAQPMTTFELTDGDGELADTLNQMKTAANTRLRAMRAQNLQKLSHLYDSLNSKYSLWVQDKYSYTNQDSRYRELKHRLDVQHEDNIDSKEQAVSDAIAQAKADYQAKRQRELEPQIQLLQQQYDEDHASAYAKSLHDAEADVTSDIEAHYTATLVELDKARNEEAQQAFSKITNSIMNELQAEFDKMREAENALYEETATELDKFRQDNYVRETQRVEALSKRQEDLSEAERVRRELTEKINSMQDDLDAQTRKAATDVKNRDLEIARLKGVQADAEARVEARYHEQIEILTRNMEAVTLANKNLQDVVKSNSSFTDSLDVAPNDDENTEVDTPATTVIKKRHGKGMLTGIGALLAVGVIGGGAVVANNQTHENDAKMAKMSSNYQSLQGKYTTLSKNADKASSELADQKAQSAKDAKAQSILADDKSVEAKSTASGDTSTIRVASSANYDVGQSLLARQDDKPLSATVSNVDKSKHVVTVHVDSLNKDYTFTTK